MLQVNAAVNAMRQDDATAKAPPTGVGLASLILYAYAYCKDRDVLHLLQCCSDISVSITHPTWTSMGSMVLVVTLKAEDK